MWYRIILSAVRTVGKGGEYTIHKTKTPGIRNPIFTMSGQFRDPTSAQGAGSKVFGEGHYTSQNPVVSFGYRFPYTRVEKLPYGTRIFDHDDISPELFNRILVSAGVTDPSLKATSNKTMEDLLNAGISYSQINKILVGLDFDAVEYNAFQNFRTVYRRVSESVKDLLIDHFIKFDKKRIFGDNSPDLDLIDDYEAEIESNFDSVLRFLKLNLDKISGSEKQKIINIYNASVIGETRSLSESDKDYLRDLNEFNNSIVQQYIGLKEEMDIYYKDKNRKITEKKVNSVLRQLSKKNILIINSVVLTNPKLFQRERFRPETLTPEEKEYLEKKKYSTSYDVSKELVLSAMEKFGNDWQDKSGLQIPLPDLLKLIDEGVLPSDTLSERSIENLSFDEFIGLLDYGKINEELLLSKLNAYTIPNDAFDKLINLKDKTLAKKMIGIFIKRALIVLSYDSGLKLLKNGFLSIDDAIYYLSRKNAFLRSFDDLKTLIEYGASSKDILDKFQIGYNINETPDEYKALGISEKEVLSKSDDIYVQKLIGLGFSPEVVFENTKSLSFDLTSYYDNDLMLSNIKEFLKAGVDYDEIMDKISETLPSYIVNDIDIKISFYRDLVKIIKYPDLLINSIFNRNQELIVIDKLSRINEKLDSDKILLPENSNERLNQYIRLKNKIEYIQKYFSTSLLCYKCGNLGLLNYGFYCQGCGKTLDSYGLSFSTSYGSIESKVNLLNDFLPVLELLRSNSELLPYVESIRAIIDKNLDGTLGGYYYSLRDLYPLKPFFENSLILSFLPAFDKYKESVYNRFPAEGYPDEEDDFDIITEISDEDN